MKITAVESIPLLGHYHLVRVHTDEGVSGVGEVSAAIMNPAVTHAAVDKVLGPLLIGEDPTDIERLWQKMFYKSYKTGPMGAQMQAIAGIDTALWDIAGKVAGVPVYKLLGGKVRDDAEVYASSMDIGIDPVDEARRAVELKEQGYYGYKIHSATPWMYDRGPDRTKETVKEVRAAVGDDYPLYVDVHNAYFPGTALELARWLEQYDISHLEEPIAAHDYPGYRRLTDAVDLRIAAGEQEYTIWQFRDLILNAGVDILQPDVTKCGGITHFRKIAALAETFNKPITVHNTQPTIGNLAHVHLWVSMPSCAYPQEYAFAKHPLRDEWPIWKTPVVQENGRIRPPDEPGLGVELDEDMLKRVKEMS